MSANNSLARRSSAGAIGVYHNPVALNGMETEPEVQTTVENGVSTNCHQPPKNMGKTESTTGLIISNVYGEELPV